MLQGAQSLRTPKTVSALAWSSPQAHKWFNIAAMRGHTDAAQLRREIAEQMSDAEIGCAQRAARDWLKAHPQAPAPVRAIRVAA